MNLHTGIVGPHQLESLAGLLFELHAHYNEPPTATPAEVRTHLVERLLQAHSGLTLIVAFEADDVVLGFAALSLLHSLVEPGPADRRQCLLKELYVRSSARGRGIGRALVRSAARHAVDNGCGRMDWNVKAGNLRGIGFYEGLGGARVQDRLSYRLDRAGLLRLAESTVTPAGAAAPAAHDPNQQRPTPP
jgi:ribosomal protein S18 acetylase RimI-like enzyme